jgi:hypothetical protein
MSTDLELVIANAARDAKRHVKEVVLLESQIKTLSKRSVPFRNQNTGCR